MGTDRRIHFLEIGYLACVEFRRDLNTEIELAIYIFYTSGSLAFLIVPMA